MIELTASDFRPGRGSLAVWRRNVRVWRKLIRVSIVLNFGEPVIYLLALGYGLQRFVGAMDGLPYMVFLASGLLVSAVMHTTAFEAMYSVYTRMEPQKTYQAILATPVRVADIVAGELLWCATKGVIASTAILIVAGCMGLISFPGALGVIPVAFLTGLAFAGFVMPLAPFARSYDYFSYFYTLVIVPMFMCSGVFYPVDSLPAAGQWAASLLPLYHAVELARPLATQAPLSAPLVHGLVLLLYAGAGYALSVRFYSRRLLQ